VENKNNTGLMSQAVGVYPDSVAGSEYEYSDWKPISINAQEKKNFTTYQNWERI